MYVALSLSIILTISTALCTVAVALCTRRVGAVHAALKDRLVAIDDATMELAALRSRVQKLGGRIYWDERHPRRGPAPAPSVGEQHDLDDDVDGEPWFARGTPPPP